jgi:hypothetical protein
MMNNALNINDKTLKLLRQHVMVDSDITEEQRQKDLNTIANMKQMLDSGECVPVDRMAMIKKAAEKKQKGKNVTFRKKLKAKSRKIKRNATEDTRSLRAVDAFDEKFMYSSDSEIKTFADSMGITETYNETKRFDEEWN